MAGEGTHRRRRWFVLAILVLLVVLPVTVLVSGTCLVIVENETGADAGVTVFLGPQPVGAGPVADGDSTWYLFTPHLQQDSEFSVGCRSVTHPIVRTARVGYGPSPSRIFRITLGPCGRIKRYSETAIL